MSNKIKIIPFQKRVYEIVKRIPKGKTMSYGQIARKLKTSPRAVGQALKKNPSLIKIPCHRVIMSDGKIGGYKGNSKKNIRVKRELLKQEGVVF